jgi:pre-mRNA-splicing factor 18
MAFSDTFLSQEVEDKLEAIDIPSEEIVRRLRNKGEPIRLFGETDKERYERLKLLETTEANTGVC